MDKIGAPAYLMGWYRWKRQLHLHKGMVNFWKKVEHEANEQAVAGRRPDADAVVDKLDGVTVGLPRQVLSEIDRMTAALLAHPGSKEPFDTVMVRHWFRNGVFQKVAKAKTIADMCAALLEKKLIVEAKVADIVRPAKKARKSTTPAGPDPDDSSSAEEQSLSQSAKEPSKGAKRQWVSGKAAKTRAYTKCYAASGATTDLHIP